MATGQDAASQESGVLSIAAGHAVDLAALRRWDATVDGMARTGDLVAMSRLNDPSLEGRTHEYLAQHFAGLPVYGGGVSRQLDGSGVTVSLFGTVHQGIDVDVTPALSGAEVAALLEEMHGGEILAGRDPSLGILPLADGSYALAYLVTMSDGYFYFADADDGGILHRINAVKEQSAVGAGEGSQGIRQKLSTTQADGRFEAHDRMRPAEVVTLDLRFNFLRYFRLLVDHLIDNHAARRADLDGGRLRDRRRQRLGRLGGGRRPRLHGAGPTTISPPGTAGKASTARTGARSPWSTWLWRMPSSPLHRLARKAPACSGTAGSRTRRARSHSPLLTSSGTS